MSVAANPIEGALIGDDGKLVPMPVPNGPPIEVEIAAEMPIPVALAMTRGRQLSAARRGLESVD